MDIDISIVTASYNYGRYIGECLQSVADQEGVTIEHLIFDGGSTDDTIEVVSKFPHVTFVQEPDSGMCDAINKGFRAAKGKWVMWLNSDDRLLPGALAAFKEFAESQEKADVIYGGWNFIHEDGSHKRKMTLFPYQPGMMIYLGCFIGSTAAFYRRSTIVDEGQLLNEDFRYVMDGEYYARLHSLGKRFVYFPKLIADFRWHGENLSLRNHGKAGIDNWLTLQKQFSETRAIRRTYGRVWFKDDTYNGFVDAPIYLFWKICKPILKAIHRHRMID